MNYLIPFFTAVISIANFVHVPVDSESTPIIADEHDAIISFMHRDSFASNLWGLDGSFAERGSDYQLQAIADGRLESTILSLTGGHVAIDDVLDALGWCIYTLEWLLGNHGIQLVPDSIPTNHPSASCESLSGDFRRCLDASRRVEATRGSVYESSMGQSFTGQINR